MDWWAGLYCLAVAVIFLTIVFFIARRRNRYDLIDSAWGFTFIGIAIVGYLAQPRVLFSLQSLVSLLVIVWGMCLSLHIYHRWSRASREDRRYNELRSKYSKNFGGVAGGMYFKVYLVQAVLAWVISLPVIVINAAPSLDIGWYVWIGLVIWSIGFYFEAVGDAQLAKFTQNSRNKGKLMTQGLWRFTRHPNYFGEVTLWWGIFVICLAANLSLITVIGPLTITFLILFVSGVPLTERHFEGRPGWTEYMRKTSKFIPLPPRH